MKKEIKKYDMKSILRWIALLPALAVTWYAVSMVSIEIESWMVDIPAMTPSSALLSVIITLALLPSVAMFFVARFIVPKYKNISGISAVVLCILWVVFLVYAFYGFSHTAY